MYQAPEKQDGGRQWLKLLPLAPMLLLLLCGIAFTFGQSLSFKSDVPLFHAYSQALKLPGLGRNSLFSLYVAAVSSSLSVCTGTALACLVWRLPGSWRRWSTGFYLPLILPHITTGFLVMLFFSQSGVAASIFHSLGLERFYQAPLFRGDGAGIIMAYLYKSAPFAFVLVFPVLRHIPPAYLQTARMLGAGEVRSFFQIILPRLLPGMGSAWIILFVYSFGAYDLPFIIGESSPRMISLYLFRLYFARPLSERPVAAALLFLVFAAGMVMVVVYARLAAGIEEKERRI
jgi:putative spermidine/putrescine transport system permease protein